MFPHNHLPEPSYLQEERFEDLLQWFTQSLGHFEYRVALENNIGVKFATKVSNDDGNPCILIKTAINQGI